MPARQGFFPVSLPCRGRALEVPVGELLFFAFISTRTLVEQREGATWLPRSLRGRGETRGTQMTPNTCA